MHHDTDRVLSAVRSFAAAIQPLTRVVEIGCEALSLSANASGSAAASTARLVMPKLLSLICIDGPMPLITVRSSP